MRDAICVLGAALVVAGLTAGCAVGPRARLASGSATAADGAAPPPATPVTPPPPSSQATYPCAPPPCAPKPCAPPPCGPPTCPPCWSGCGLPCEEGLGGWRIRALGGFSFWSGTDAADNCGYLGADIGHMLPCSCWGVDGFYRRQTAEFDRDPSGKDGGTWNFVGVKATYERSFGGGRLFWWVGAGPQYFWTSDYLDNDSGFAGYGEAGLGYVVSRNVKIRAGVNVDVMNTDVGRKSPLDDEKDRWLFMFAPVLELEIDF